MAKWFRGFRGAVLLGLAWAVAWAPIAVLVGLIIDPDGSMDEMWPAIGAYPGFLCGALLVAGLSIAGRGLDELPAARAAAWGTVVGLLVGSLPFAIGEPGPEIPVWRLAAIVIGSITLLGAMSAAASAVLLRSAARRQGARPA